MKDQAKKNLRSRRNQRPMGETSSRDQDEVSRLMDLGDFYFRSENFSAALESYGHARSALPRYGHEYEKGLLDIKAARCHKSRGEFQKAIEYLDQAKVDLRTRRDSLQLGKLYSLRGNILLQMGRYVRAQRYCELAYKLLRGTGENAALGEIELALGVILGRLGDKEKAVQYFTSALSTFRRVDDESGVARSLNNLGLIHKDACNWRESIRCLNGALELSEKHAIATLSALIRQNLGIVHFKLGDWVLAEEFLNRSRQLSRELGITSCFVRNCLALGNLERRRRRWDAALELYEAALEKAEENDYSRESVLAMEFLGELHLDREEYDLSAEHLTRALARAEEIAPLGDLVNEICRRLGEVRLGQGRAEEALTLGQRALSSASRMDDQYERAITCRLVGLAYASLGRSREAEQFLGEAVDSLTRISESFELALTVMRIGKLEDQPQDRATDLLKQAFGIFLSLDSRGYAAIAAYEVARHHFDHDNFDEAIMYLDRSMGLTNEDVEPGLWTRILRLRRDVEDAYASRWVRAGGGIDSFRELARLFQGNNDVATALGELVRLGVSRTQSDRGFLAFGDSPASLRIFGEAGFEEGEAEALRTRLGRILKDAMLENRPVLVSKLSADPRFTGEDVGALERVRTLAVLPLALPSGGPGVFYVDRLRGNALGAFNQGEINLLTLVSNLAALSVLESQRKELLQENRTLKSQLWSPPHPDIITNNPRMIEILRMVDKLADCPASVLIEGETGTGKGLIAQAIHNQSSRGERPFIQVNCAALPEQLLESELFGHVQGAFTGAVREKTGLFKEAAGGTLFLDEVDKTTETLQAKLLHVLDKKEIRPVGSTKWETVDTRVLCATNADLKDRIRSGRFLEDLYYRLNDFILKVPPLRERRDDIPLLVDYFLRKFSAQYGKGTIELLPEALDSLKEQDWRGNVRELEKTIRRIVVLAEENEPIGLDAVPQDRNTTAPQPNGGPLASLRDEVARTERRVIGEALAKSSWNKSQAARDLKVSYPCLLKKIKELGLERRSSR